MKKIKFFGLAALLALGFGFMSCDEGVANDEFEAQTKEGGYADEIPTYYAAVTTTGNSAEVSAIWDFENTLVDLSSADFLLKDKSDWLNIDGTIKSTGATGATLKPSDDIKGRTKNNMWSEAGGENAFAVAADNTASLASMGKFYFTLVLAGQSNIVINACGGGAANAARFLAITAEDDTPIAYKGALASKKPVKFAVVGAPAGTYKIWVAGSCIQNIAVGDIAVTAPSQVSALKITTAQEDIETIKIGTPLNLKVVDTADENSSLNADALWTSSNESVATVKEGVVTGVGAGTAVIRARIGRFYDQRTVKVELGEDAISKASITVGYTSEDENASLDETITVNLFKSLLSDAGVEALAKDSVISGYISDSGNHLKNLTAKVTTAAENHSFTFSLAATAEKAAATGKIVINIPAVAVKSGTAVSFEIPYTIKNVAPYSFDFTEEMATAGTYNVDAEAGTLTLVTVNDNKLGWTTVTDSASGETLGSGLNARAATGATVVRSCTLTGLAPATYSVKLGYYDNAGNNTKKFIYQVGDGDVQTLASGGVKGADKSVTFEITIADSTTAFKFASQGTDGLLLTSMKLTPQ